VNSATYVCSAGRVTDSALVPLGFAPRLVLRVFALGLLDGGFLHEHSLPLLALSGAGELDDDRGTGMSQRAAGEGHVARREELQPGEPRALEAPDAHCAVDDDELPAAEAGPARITPPSLWLIQTTDRDASRIAAQA
jgi:hypothetical protein